MSSNYSGVKYIKLSDHYKQLFSDYHSRSKNPELKMQWSTTRVSGSPRDALLYRYFAASVALAIWGFMTFLWGIEGNEGFILTNALVLGTICGSAAAARETKVIYRYRVFNTHARLAYCLKIPRHAGTFCKGFAVFGLCCAFIIGIISGSFLIFAGPGGVAIFAALRLLNMKVPRKRRWSAPWDEYNFVTVDRKRRFVITHIDDDTLGFEARLPNDELMEQYLTFLRSVLPPTAQFTEKKWNLSLI
ncbi:hypothetical protein TRP66_20450 [Pseudomonas sp. JDS28PS106]|uniref:hypothetical protein n=1 Tax=Pseudomonas sp. JDS28PS106 TaxID=2497235 RepID=UPI002FCF2306